MAPNVDDRLSWLAMQYVLGELSDADRDQFEIRLADDLAACEAVAQASRLQLALQAAIASSVAVQIRAPLDRLRQESGVIPGLPQSRSATGCTVIAEEIESSAIQPVDCVDIKTRSQRSWQAVGAAVVAVACLFMVMIFGWRDGADSDRSRVASHSDQAALELVSRWRTEMKFTDVDSDDLDDDVHDNAADMAIPAWLLAGVSLEKHGVVDSQLEDLQDN